MSDSYAIKVTIPSRYSLKNIAIMSFSCATGASLLFLVMIQHIGAFKTSLSKASVATFVFGAALFVYVFLNFIAIRHIWTARFDGLGYWTWGGNNKPFNVIVQVIVSATGAVSAVLGFCFSKFEGLIGAFAALLITLHYEEYCRSKRFKRRILLGEIAAVESAKGEHGWLNCRLVSGQRVSLPHVRELDLGSPSQGGER